MRLETERLRAASEKSRANNANHILANHGNQDSNVRGNNAGGTASIQVSRKRQTPVPHERSRNAADFVRRVAMGEGLRGENLVWFTRHFANESTNSGQIRRAVSAYFGALQKVRAEFSAYGIPENLMQTYAIQIAAGRTEDASRIMREIRNAAEEKKVSVTSGIGTSGESEFLKSLLAEEEFLKSVKVKNSSLHSQLINQKSEVNKALFRIIDSLKGKSIPRAGYFGWRREIHKNIVKMLMHMAGLGASGHVPHDALIAYSGAEPQHHGFIEDAIWHLKRVGIIRVYQSTGRQVGETLQLNLRHPVARYFVPYKERNNH